MGRPNGVKRALEGLHEIESVTFDADVGRFEAKVVAGETVSKEQVVELIMGHGQSRGMAYEIRWGEPPKQAATKLAARAEPFDLPTLGGGRYDLGAVLGRRPIVLVLGELVRAVHRRGPSPRSPPRRARRADRDRVGERRCRARPR